MSCRAAPPNAGGAYRRVTPDGFRQLNLGDNVRDRNQREREAGQDRAAVHRAASRGRHDRIVAPARQWVLAVPRRLRYFLHRDAHLKSAASRRGNTANPERSGIAAVSVNSAEIIGGAQLVAADSDDITAPRRPCFDPSSIRLESRERMFDPFAGPRRRDDVVAVPRIWLTFALSILVHIAALWVVLPRLPLLSPGEEQGQASDRLQVQLAALPPPAPAPPPPPKLPTPTRETRAILSPRPRPRNAPTPEAPPELVVPSPEVPEIPMPPPTPAVAEPTPPQPPVAGDLSSFIASRRRARGEEAAPVESDNERRDRIVASNMPTISSPIAGNQVKRGGGLFEITRMTYDDAQFLFSAGTRMRAAERRRRLRSDWATTATCASLSCAG